MIYQQILGAFAAGLHLYSFLPYFSGIFKRTVKPHAFTWLIWSLLSGITFAAQIVEHAGAGAWLTGVNSLACLITAMLAFKFGTKSITRSDWFALSCGLMAIPVWKMTHDPLWSVIIVCVIDAIAFWPTARKSWHAPFDEALQAYWISGLAALISIAAMEEMTLVSILYPVCISVLNFSFVVMDVMRRRFVKN